MATKIDRMDDRFDAFEAAAKLGMPNRHIKNELKHHTDHEPQEVTDGVLTIVSASEGDYNNSLGMEAKEGTQRLVCIGHLKVAETDSKKAVQDAEFDFIEEFKAFIRSGVSGMSLRLENVQHSRQLDHPFGWFVAIVDAGPPGSNVY